MFVIRHSSFVIRHLPLVIVACLWVLGLLDRIYRICWILGFRAFVLSRFRDYSSVFRLPCRAVAPGEGGCHLSSALFNSEIRIPKSVLIRQKNT